MKGFHQEGSYSTAETQRRKGMPFLLPLLALSSVCFCSCRETWTKGTTDTFYEGCTQEAQKWAGSPERAKAYCDCVFEKMKAKYPHEEDALAHIDSLAKDPDLIKCKDEVMDSSKQ